ncbi:transporter substrate-binding domain-containing protein [Marinobacteraceae bacterium S3BR75-40.1]
MSGFIDPTHRGGGSFVRRLSFFLAAIAMFSPCVAAAESPPASSVHIVSQVWKNYTNPDGSGLAWDIVRSVFEDAGLTLDYQTMPYKRAVRMVREGKADAWVASYRNEQTFALYPEWPHDYEVTSVVGLHSAFTTWNGPDSLRGKRIAFIRGYNLEQYIDPSFEPVEVTTLSQGIEMAAMGRVDFAIEARQDILEYLDTRPEFQRALELREVLRLGLYLGFNDSVRSRRLIRVWDQHFPELLESGELRNLYVKYGYGEDFNVDWGNR